MQPLVHSGVAQKWKRNYTVAVFVELRDRLNSKSI